MPNNKKSPEEIKAINEKKAKLMAVRLSAYKTEQRPSYFEQLENGVVRRAVEREASFNVNAYRQSDSYAAEMSAEDIDNLYLAHVEYYSKLIIDNRKRSNYNPYDTNDFEHRLIARDNLANQNFEDLSYTVKEGSVISKTSITQNKVMARSKNIDDRVTDKNNVIEHIQKMKMMEGIRVYH